MPNRRDVKLILMNVLFRWNVCSFNKQRKSLGDERRVGQGLGRIIESIVE